MGYYVSTMGVDFTIKKDNLNDAYNALCALNTRDELKMGGIWTSTPCPKPESSTSVANNPMKNFSWMPWNYDELCNDTQSILNEIGFKTDIDNEGNLNILYFPESKSGAEDHFLEAIAPFVEDGSYIKWQGEEGEMWRSEFENGEMRTLYGKVVWK